MHYNLVRTLAYDAVEADQGDGPDVVDWRG
jgi:hypothetical protein